MFGILGLGFLLGMCARACGAVFAGMAVGMEMNRPSPWPCF